MTLLKDTINNALNKQLNQELKNSYLYLSMAAYFGSKGLRGFEKFFLNHAREELQHAMRIYKYILDAGGRVEFFELPKPKHGWKGVREVIEDFYSAELENTKRIHELVELARRENDLSTESFLKWFVDEQVEEMSLASGLLEKVRLLGDEGASLLVLDSRLASEIGEK